MSFSKLCIASVAVVCALFVGDLKLVVEKLRLSSMWLSLLIFEFVTSLVNDALARASGIVHAFRYVHVHWVLLSPHLTRVHKVLLLPLLVVQSFSRRHMLR